VLKFSRTIPHRGGRGMACSNCGRGSLNCARALLRDNPVRALLTTHLCAIALVASWAPLSEFHRQLAGDVKYDSKKAANVLMVVEDRCLVSALVEPRAKIGPIHRISAVCISRRQPSRGGRNAPVRVIAQTKHQFQHRYKRLNARQSVDLL
jgi:hypothetical protein